MRRERSPGERPERSERPYKPRRDEETGPESKTRRPGRFEEKGKRPAPARSGGGGGGAFPRKRQEERPGKYERDGRPARSSRPSEPRRTTPRPAPAPPPPPPAHSLQPLQLDRPYPAAHLGIICVAYAALGREEISDQLRELQNTLQSSGGEAICRAFSRVAPEGREFWAVWEDSATGKFYFTAGPLALGEVVIPFQLPQGWFRPVEKMLKWRETDESGKTLYILRHKAVAPEVRHQAREGAGESSPEAGTETE